jgi:hypothetical protein
MVGRRPDSGHDGQAGSHLVTCPLVDATPPAIEMIASVRPRRGRLGSHWLRLEIRDSGPHLYTARRP